MKLKILIPLLALALAGCSDDDSSPPNHAAHHGSSDQDETEPTEKAPRLGMTEGEIRHMYGDPNQISHSGRGDVWHYWFNHASAFIPYNFGYHPRYGTFIFDDNGRLVDFNYNE